MMAKPAEIRTCAVLDSLVNSRCFEGVDAGIIGYWGWLGGKTDGVADVEVPCLAVMEKRWGGGSLFSAVVL